MGEKLAEKIKLVLGEKGVEEIDASKSNIDNMIHLSNH